MFSGGRMVNILHEKSWKTGLRLRPRSGSAMREARWGLIFAAPAVFFFTIFFVYPLLWAGWISLHDWGLLNTPTWNGLENYQRLFSDRQFWNSVGATIQYTLLTVVPIWLLAFGLALLFRRSFPLRRTYLTLVYLPAVVSLTVWCLLFLLIYQPSYGLLTAVTRPLGFENVRWLNDLNLAMPSLALLSVIKGTPAYMVIYLAGLTSIPNDYYEAAAIDGAGPMQRTLYITLPIMRPVILYVSVLSILNAFQAFSPAYLLTQGGPGSATRLLPLFIYEQGFSYFRMGYASAASMVMFIALLLLTLFQFRFFGARSQTTGAG
jgi:multiple sugar transport system permease protein